MIDLITGHQGIPHISAEQISTLHRSLMGSNGDNKVVRMKDGGVNSVGLTVSIDTGYWRVHGYDMQIQEAEAVIFDPTEAGYQRIDDLFVEILQDISSGVQRSELVIVQGEPSTTTPIAPAPPTEAASEYDLLVECVPVCSVLVIEGAMTMTDLTIPFKASSGDSESLAPEFDPDRPEPYEIGEIVEQEGKLYIFIRQHSGPWNDADVEETTVAALLAGKADIPVTISQGGTGATSAAQARTDLGAASQTDLENTMDLIRGDNDEYSSLKSYKVGQYVVVKPPLVAEETIYKCISPCSPGSWAINQSHFEAKTLTEAVTDLNNDLLKQQSGKTALLTMNTDYTSFKITMPRAFADENYRVFLTAEDSNGIFDALWVHPTSERTSSTFKVLVYCPHSFAAHNLYINWLAIHD